MPSGQETRVTDPDTGGQKGSKLARFDLVPARAMLELAEHFGRGAKKYKDRNWEKGYGWSLSYAALQRHLNAFWSGEDIDSETGHKHIVAAMWHCVVLSTFMDTHPEKDDRPSKAPQQKKWHEQTFDLGPPEAYFFTDRTPGGAGSVSSR